MTYIDDSETYKTMCCEAAMNSYFEDRPQLLRTREQECFFEAGFNAAWVVYEKAHKTVDLLDQARLMLGNLVGADRPEHVLADAICNHLYGDL